MRATEVENGDLIKDLLTTPIHELPIGGFLGALYLKITPPDRGQAFEHQPSVPKLPGVANLKDLPGGPAGIIKGVIVDNAKPIFGAQPFSSSEKQHGTIDAAFVNAAEDILNGVRAKQEKFKLSEFDQAPPEVRARFFAKIRSDASFRAAVASTVAGRQFLKDRQIEITARDQITGAVASVLAGVAPGKKGGPAGIKPAVAGAVSAIVAGVVAVEQFFAANPPDP